MKLSAMYWVRITTLLLITITIFATLNLSFGLVFFATVFGQIALLIMAYKVLRDDYTTDKTFRDFYEDRPDLGR
jgi:hypothetical protein